MTFNRQKFFIAVVCALLGWGIGYQMGKTKAEEEFARRGGQFGISKFFGIPFFTPPEVFDENERPETPSWWDRFWGRKPKQELSEEDGSLLDNPFSLFGGRAIEQPKITTREDDENVYMDLDLESFDKNSLSARVENGTVIIEGNQKTVGNGSSMSSHFFQSFQAPAGTDPSKVDMSHENNKLVLKFPKIK